MNAKLEKLTKRSFIKSAVAMGVPTGSLYLGTQSGLAGTVDDPKEEVPYVARMRVKRNEEGRPIGREPIYKTIARDVWVDSKATTKAASKIQKQIENNLPNSEGVLAIKKNRIRVLPGVVLRFSSERSNLRLRATKLIRQASQKFAKRFLTKSQQRWEKEIGKLGGKIFRSS